MTSARTDSRPPRAPATAGLIGALVLGALLVSACGGEAAAPTTPADVRLAGTVQAEPAAAAPAPGGSGLARTWVGIEPSADADRLEAARTVALYCHLVEAGQFARAGELCARRRLWSRRALAGLRRFHFRSARVFAAPDARTLVLKARVRVHAGRARPLPDGLAIVFFTLGRAGSAVGGWLITAVSTSP